MNNTLNTQKVAPCGEAIKEEYESHPELAKSHLIYVEYCPSMSKVEPR